MCLPSWSLFSSWQADDKKMIKRILSEMLSAGEEIGQSGQRKGLVSGWCGW